VDCKFFDIPSTMLTAVQATFDSGASVCTVHAMAGAEALKALANLEQKLNLQRPFRILAVTILTSWDEQSLPEIYKPQPISQHVLQLARLVASCGLRSVVCSPEEIVLLAPEKLFLLTPGIRLPTDEVGDQKRVMGPKEAISLGSSCLVVGRPIVTAQKPREAAQLFLSKMA
jgi:orotidine-5'-phosphate decarboxylase